MINSSTAQQRFNISRVAAAAIFACASLGHQTAHAIDVDAGDYTAAPEGTTLGLLYYQHAERTKLYVGGNALSAQGGFDSDIGILRVIHFMKLGGYTIDPQILLPFGHLSTSGDFANLGSASGVGDPILAATLWTINSAENNEYLGFTPFLYVPAGRYQNNSALNLGENRWKYAFQVGYIKGLGKYFTVDMMADATGYGKNDDVGAASVTMKQDPTYSIQAHLRYHVTPALDFRVSVNRAWVGETTTAGVAANDRSRNTKMTVGAAWWPVPRVQLIANYGRDLEVTNGFKESDRVNLRAMYAF